MNSRQRRKAARLTEAQALTGRVANTTAAGMPASTPAPPGPAASQAYGQILKSSSIMGGVAGFNQLLRMVRTKFAAVLIGTVGSGLIANFGAIQGFVGTLAGLGFQSSAVLNCLVRNLACQPTGQASYASLLVKTDIAHQG